MKYLLVFSLLLTSLTGFSQSKIYKKKHIQKAMKKAFVWQQAHRKHDLSDWTNGAYYAGVSQAWQSTGDEAYLKGMKALIDSTKASPGRLWFHADDIAICQTYVDVYKIDSTLVDLAPTKQYLDKLIEEGDDYEWKYGYQSFLWWWCDALFMGPPAFVKYGLATGENKYLEASDKWYRETYDTLFNKEESLFARDKGYLVTASYEGKKEENGKPIFWSRGNGWVFGGLCILLENLPADYPNRPFYENLYKTMAARLLELQPEDGKWRSSLLYPEGHQYGEASGTGFFTFGFAWGINNGLLDKATYLPAVKKAWAGLLTCQNKEGMVGYVQPIGASPSLQVNEDLWEVYGTGAFLCAGAEVLKLNIK